MLALEIFFTGLLVLASLAIGSISALVLFRLFKGQKKLFVLPEGLPLELTHFAYLVGN